MALLLTAVQIFSPTKPPFVLFLVFAGVWIFGAVMLLRAPTFGAIGTALYGVILAVQLFQMHGTGALDIIIGTGSLLGSALAVGYLMVRRRQHRSAVM